MHSFNAEYDTCVRPEQVLQLTLRSASSAADICTHSEQVLTHKCLQALKDPQGFVARWLADSSSEAQPKLDPKSPINEESARNAKVPAEAHQLLSFLPAADNLPRAL